MRLHPVYYSGLILVLSQAVTLFVAFQEQKFLQERDIVLPELSIGLPLIYFFGAVVILGLILFFIPVSKLKMVLRLLFLFLMSWGVFVALGLVLPIPVASVMAIACGLLWFFFPRVWLHDLLMIFALASVGAVFGFLFSPWTVVAFMLVISVYDVLAVRFGYMMWMVSKLAQSDFLPAFVIPREVSNWIADLRRESVFEDESAERKYSLIGGGDIAFPLLLAVAAFSAYGFGGSMMVAVFSLLGLISAYLIQQFFLKGKPMPALPPIAVMSLVGVLLASLLPA